MNPIIPIAVWTLFLPTSRSTTSASLKAAPVCSKKAPMIIPKRMTIPILPRVIPNPSLILDIITSKDSPEAIAKNKEANKSAKKGCKL